MYKSKEDRNAYYRRYSKTSKRQEWRKNYRKKPHFRKYLKSYQQTEKYKAYRSSTLYNLAYKKYRCSIRGRFTNGKKVAKAREIDFRLTLEEYTHLTETGVCHYCNRPLNLQGIGLDRKDNNVGYILENVVPCCAECNRIKGDSLTYAEMVAVANLLKGMRTVKTN